MSGTTTGLEDATGPAADVEGRELRVRGWPGESFAIGDGIEDLGFRAFRLSPRFRKLALNVTV